MLSNSIEAKKTEGNFELFSDKFSVYDNFTILVNFPETTHGLL